MAGRQHHYRVTVEWTGNQGSGTRNYAGYSRNHTVTAGTKAPIEGSSDPAFRGDPSRWNPEELLLASISACHKLWYLHLCSDAGISVVSYRDEPEATMVEEKTGAGHFVKATLRPWVTIEPGSDAEKARALHRDAHRFCFIANSVNFPIECEPVITVSGA